MELEDSVPHRLRHHRESFNALLRRLALDTMYASCLYSLIYFIFLVFFPKSVDHSGFVIYFPLGVWTSGIIYILGTHVMNDYAHYKYDKEHCDEC